MRYSHLLDSAKNALVTALALVLVGATSFIMLEPVVGHSQATEIFEIKQTITGEISFLASTSPVTMVGSIAGVTGGTSWGTTTSRVLTNNSTGYNMTIQFASSTAMYRDGGNGEIPNYRFSSTSASYNFDTSPSNGQFGFTVNASTTGEVATAFLDNGTDCGVGSNETVNQCWKGASTTLGSAGATTIINSSASTPSSGSTTTLQFRVTVPPSPSPAIPTGVYTATATLTATTNP